MLMTQVADNKRKEKKEKNETFIDWCSVCETDTEHRSISGHNGLKKYSYAICSRCGNKI